MGYLLDFDRKNGTKKMLELGKLFIIVNINFNF